jgi:acyl-CoA thioesterase I
VIKVKLTVVLLCLLLGSMHLQAKTLMVLGDSLSAGYGIDISDGWVHLLQDHLEKSQRDVHVINASVSGETSGGALSRLPNLLKEHSPDIVLIELGGNDGLRGHPISLLRKNLLSIIQTSRNAGANILLLGIQIPPNYGKRYTQQFSKVYPTLAEQEQAALVPFFLDKVATQSSLMQEDGIHPTAAAQQQLLDNVLPHLNPLLNNKR